MPATPIHAGMAPRTAASMTMIASSAHSAIAMSTPNACESAFPAASLDLMVMAFATVASHRNTAMTSSTVNDAVITRRDPLRVVDMNLRLLAVQALEEVR